MKITAIESLHWSAFPRLLVVRVHSEGGLIGLGETVDKLPAARAALHGTLAPLLLGQDALDIEGLWRFAMDNLMYHGFAGAETRALSALEMALWDLMGKHYDAPLCHLLGGKTRAAIPTYNTCIGFGDWPDYQAWHEDAGALARSLLADGIQAMKIWPFDRFSEESFGQRISPAQIDQGLQPIRQIRDAVGKDMEIGIECHFRWNRVSMERIARALEPYDILFLEDALPAVHPAEIKALGAKTHIPLVGSELLMTRWQLREWLEEGVTPIVMTDPVWNGGVGETRKIAALAETYGVPLVLHNVAGPICHAACMHLGAHIPNLYYVESVRAFYRSYFAILSDFTPQISAGQLDVPPGPGLGIQLNDAVLARSDLNREISEGKGLAKGRRHMGDHWAVAELR
ncbi:MAG: mandelate racemase/muconate lactonizing enzyme family protein [Chloroflexi bacterium]|nr:mandelate racemase/muconate lactonizing enzyme family protein [Chloroflexota bacterium]